MSDETQVIEVDACDHPELVSSGSVMRHESTLQCTACGKKVAFPDETVIRASEEDQYHLLLITFGPKWADWWKRTHDMPRPHPMCRCAIVYGPSEWNLPAMIGEAESNDA